MPAIADADTDLDRLAGQLAALGHGTRLRIYRVLLRAGPEGLPVGRVQAQLSMAQSTLSFHLRKLVDVGLVRQTRDGRVLNCCCDMAAMGGILAFLQEECCRNA
ncbi:metalloregulator ArsR/SmtB family transcription factor [Maricaulis sp.]|jgi:DNA-binding transcriptional ArsR family regulator|uniref:ArsR/SmtB family transcription factor n=1 Tax=Maricaulis sp. TaxID=1486257 RepID=UPI00262457C1|nr:metalloregulator ArsR/SmtB family transcription factor [Maricaulis sp.]